MTNEFKLINLDFAKMSNNNDANNDNDNDNINDIAKNNMSRVSNTFLEF